MLKILFDHQKFSTQKYGGISRYFANIINGIKGNDNFDFDLGVLISKNQYLKNERLNGRQFLNQITANLPEKYLSKVNLAYSKHLIQKNNFDIFHPTYYDPYFIKQIKKPLVITVHDLTYEKLPEYFWAHDMLTYHKRLNIERADKIIAISNTTKNDLIEILKVEPDKIEVIYHGIDLTRPLTFNPIKNIPDNFILYVGDRSGYKNFYRFIDAFKLISEKFTDINIVLTGGGNLACAEIELLLRLKISNKIFHYNVDDEQLNYLYSKALMFVYPSFYEGFGLPILEAYSVNCPIVISNIACFKEVAGDAAVYFDPYNVDELAYQIETILNNSNFKKSIAKKQAERLSNFTLKKSVDKTLNLYQSLTS